MLSYQYFDINTPDKLIFYQFNDWKTYQNEGMCKYNKSDVSYIFLITCSSVIAIVYFLISV